MKWIKGKITIKAAKIMLKIHQNPLNVAANDFSELLI